MVFLSPALADTHYVDIASTNPVPPYTNWTTAATVIQQAVDTASPNDTVLVADGVYSNGGRTVYGSMTNRVVITKPVTVRSANGPEMTSIVGAGPRGDAAVRCAYLTNGAALVGFTLSNGCTRATGDLRTERCGGGVWCEFGGIVSNCVLIGNSASYGGGASYGTLHNCVLRGNFAGAGGGAYYSTLQNCTISGNSAESSGGGTYGGVVQNCTISGNHAVEGEGGGACGGIVQNCTITGNETWLSGGGGGTFGGAVQNCTISGNYADGSGGGTCAGIVEYCTIIRNSANWRGGGACDGTVQNCTISGNEAYVGGGTSGGLVQSSVISGNHARFSGGGTDGGVVRNCTIIENSAETSGGGSSGGGITNSIVYYNSAETGPNYDTGTAFGYSCTIPDPGGTGNITVEPHLASLSHLSSSSPCIGRGNYASCHGTDIDGEIWLNPPCMGCDQYLAGAVTGRLSVAITAPITNAMTSWPLAFSAIIDGPLYQNVWSLGDGVAVTNQLHVTHAWSVAGNYPVVLTAYNDSWPGGISATVTVQVVEQAVHYVNLSNAAPVSPYTSWVTAATNIQDAVNACMVPGEIVLVTNGVYNSGATVTPRFSLMNRVVVTNAILVRSVNGPQVTVIRGQSPIGNGAVRCVYLANGAVLSGFTLTNGATLTGGGGDYDMGGGGAYVLGAVITNCTISGNVADEHGGGVCYGTLQNCSISGNRAGADGGGAYRCVVRNSAITDNTASSGGGTYRGTIQSCTINGNGADLSGGGTCYGTVENCTISGNVARDGGGTSGGSVVNSIVYYNSAETGPNYISGTVFGYSCTTPDPGGTGNITVEPKLASVSHISSNSPCIGRGNYVLCQGTDIDGEAWLNPPCMGCDQYVPGAKWGTLLVRIGVQSTNVVSLWPLVFSADIDAAVSQSVWSFGDGTMVTNQVYVSYSWSSAGRYAVVLTAYNDSWPGGISATVTVQVVEQAVHYVNLSNAAPVSPYTSWVTAATTIQAAVDIAPVGALVLVTNGVYSTGEKVTPGYSSMNRLVVPYAMKVRSVNGPEVTVIQGQGPIGTGAVRCVFLANGAVLSGFTLTNGYTKSYGQGYWNHELSGGGVLAYGAVVTNCNISRNAVAWAGGGVEGGTVQNCTINGNRALHGGGVSQSKAENCTISGNNGGGASSSTVRNSTISGNSGVTSGGGVAGGTVQNCTIIGNSSSTTGGGVSDATVQNCAIVSNYTGNSGGGTHNSTVQNCTIIGNDAGFHGGGTADGVVQNCTIVGNSADYGGGTSGGIVLNSIVYYNTAGHTTTGVNTYDSTVSRSCTTPAPGGTNNITAEPNFVNRTGGDYRLDPRSPCIDAGANQDWMERVEDVDGSPRIVNGRVDMGAHEFHFDGNLNVFLQGPYDTSSKGMKTLQSNIVPTNAPYAEDRRMVSVVPSNVTDWALVQVRPAAESRAIFTRSALLRNDGVIVDANGSSNFVIEVSPLTTNYIVISHLNHLAIMSVQPLVFTNQLINYDFTANSSQYYGGTNACVELEPGVWGMIAGDADGDGKITPVDREIVERQMGMRGYLSGDLNLDGVVDGKD